MGRRLDLRGAMRYLWAMRISWRWANGAFLAILLASGAMATDGGRRILHESDLPVVAAPGFRLPLDAAWSVAHGSWTAKDGVLDVVELAENKHVAVLHHNVGLASAAIECDFRIEGQGTFLIGCDGARHIGRVVIKSGGMDIAEDSVKPSHVLTSLKKGVSPGVWHRLRVEWRGDEMAASLDGKEIRARYDYLATPKTRSWLAVGKAVKVRDLEIRGTKSAGP